MKNIKTFALFVCLIVIYISCSSVQQAKIIKADLTFKSISFVNAFGSTDQQYEDYLSKIDEEVKKNESKLNNEQVKLYKYHSKLKDLDLLRSPYIFLNVEKDSVLTVYVSEKEYGKVKDIKHLDLIKEGKKALIELELIEKDKGIFYTNNIIKVSKVIGKSRSNI